ncbi:MAG: NYN domain-containing protein [Candidatus Aenigmatarchaeota archaeon]
MMAVDMLECALKDRYEAFILVSGDGDFVPALNLIKNNKKKVFSASVPRGYSSVLRSKYPFFVLGVDLLREKALK